MEYVVLSCLLLVASLFTTATEGACTHFYEGQPETQSCCCSAELDCRVQVPVGTSLSISWYYSSTSNQAAGSSIESDGTKYLIIPASLADIPVPETGLLEGTSQLFVLSLVEGDAGYYWCEMVTDGTTLPPSDTQQLVFDSSAPSGCVEGDTLELKCVREVSPTSSLANPGPTMVVESPMPMNNTGAGDAAYKDMGGAVSMAICLISALVSTVPIAYMF